MFEMKLFREQAAYVRRMIRREDLTGVPNPFEKATSVSKTPTNLAADVANAINAKSKAAEPAKPSGLAADIAAFFDDDEENSDIAAHFAERDR